MDQETMLSQIVARAKAAHKPMHKLCAEAGIAPSTYYRWKDGAQASFNNITALQKRLDEIGA